MTFIPVRTVDSARIFAVKAGDLWQPIIGVHLHGTYYERTMGLPTTAELVIEMMQVSNPPRA